MVDVVVLLGAPGSGKSSIGAELGRQGLRWREWETVLVERWESRERFLAEKATALPALHAEIMDWVDAGGPAAVFETTGLSDAPLVAQIDATGAALIVRLDVSEATALERVRERSRGLHLSDAAEDNRRTWRAFAEYVVPRQRVDLAIDTEEQSVTAAAAAILAALEPAVG